jgi:vacuolar-type H+-ATPase subunit F/Vma7
MSRAAVIGEAVRTAGFALAGAVVATTETAEEARAAWRALPADVAVLVLTPRAAAWLGDALATRPDLLVEVMPE